MREIYYRPHRAVLCDDARPRTAYVRSYWDGQRWVMHADTYFSVPAYVRAAGRTVRGFVTPKDEGLSFHAYKYRKNHAAIYEAEALSAHRAEARACRGEE